MTSKEQALEWAMKVENQKTALLRALEDLVENNRRDERGDPDYLPTDAWREQSWKNAEEALKNVRKS